MNGIQQTFLAQNYPPCFSSYISDIYKRTEHCKVEEEFSRNNYKCSPDGAFDFTILNSEDDSSLNMKNIDKLRIVLEGSNIAFDS